MTTETFELLLKAYHEKFGDFVPLDFIRSTDAKSIREAIKTNKRLWSGGRKNSRDVV